MGDVESIDGQAKQVPPEMLEKMKKVGLCPYCATIQAVANIRFDPVPNTDDAVVIKFICANPDCCAILGYQIANKAAVGLGGKIDTASGAGDVRDILANIRANPTRKA